MSEPLLLVSVRDAREARDALRGGADWIDVKEPARGALGRADGAVIDAVAEAVGGREGGGVPVSAALGEWDEALALREMRGLDRVGVVKCGTAKMGVDWERALERVAERYGRERFVVCAYADGERVAGARGVDQIVDWAVQRGLAGVGVAGVLIDTAVKDGRGLFNWCDERAIVEWIVGLREAGLWVALAGGLRGGDVVRAAGLRPNVVAVRGAACAEGERSGRVCERAVREVRLAIHGDSTHSSRPAVWHPL